MTNFTVELGKLKEQIDQHKLTQARLEANLQELGKEKDELLALANELGVDPKQVDQYIQELERDIEGQIQNLKQQLNAYSTGLN